jgi:hypothetical protein
MKTGKQLILFVIIAFAIIALISICSGCTNKINNSELMSWNIWFVNSGNKTVTFQLKEACTKIQLLPYDSIDCPASSGQPTFDTHWRAFIQDTINGLPNDTPIGNYPNNWQW